VELADLAAPGAAPACDQQRAALQGVVACPDLVHHGSSWWAGMNRETSWTLGGMSAWVISGRDGMSSHSASVPWRKNTATTEMMPVR
jgi:hypothetical protein